MPPHEAPPPDESCGSTNVLASIVVATFVISVVGTFIATLTFLRQGDIKTRIADLETQVRVVKTIGNFDDLKGFGLELDDVLKDFDTEPSLQDILAREQAARNLKRINEASKEYAGPQTPVNEELWKHMKENTDGMLLETPDDKPKNPPE